MHLFMLVSISGGMHRYQPFTLRTVPDGHLSEWMGVNNIGVTTNNQHTPDLKVEINGTIYEMNVAHAYPMSETLSGGRGSAQIMLGGKVGHRETYILIYTSPRQMSPQFAPVIVQPDQECDPHIIPTDAFFTSQLSVAHD